MISSVFFSPDIKKKADPTCIALEKLNSRRLNVIGARVIALFMNYVKIMENFLPKIPLKDIPICYFPHPSIRGWPESSKSCRIGAGLSGDAPDIRYNSILREKS